MPEIEATGYVYTTMPDSKILSPALQDFCNQIPTLIRAALDVCEQQFSTKINASISTGIDLRFRHVYQMNFYIRLENRSTRRALQFSIYDTERTNEKFAEVFSSILEDDIWPVKAIDHEPDLSRLDEFVSSESYILLAARDGQIDLAATTAPEEDITPRVAAAAGAIDDLIEAIANSNIHSTLRRFAQRYKTELDDLQPGILASMVYRSPTYRALSFKLY